MLRIVKLLVERLKPETGHSYLVTVGIHQRHPDFATPGFANGSDLGFKKLLTAFA
jgi:hypothetical protein